MTDPDVSILTATYNAAEFVERPLESVRRQTVDDARIEHVVADDGSTDDTVEVVRRFDAPYLRVVETEHSGQWDTLNRAIEAARGEYLVVLDADDEFLPELVERLAGVLDGSPDADFAYSDYYEQPVDGDRIVVDTGVDVMNTITVGVMHRAEHVERFGGFDPELYHAEYDLLLQYLDAGLDGRHVPEPLFVYHRRADSRTGDDAAVRTGLAELRERHGEGVEIREY